MIHKTFKKVTIIAKNTAQYNHTDNKHQTLLKKYKNTNKV